MVLWIELDNRLRKNITIDKTTQKLLGMERKHLIGVFERLIAIVLLLSEKIRLLGVLQIRFILPQTETSWHKSSF